jgi:Protein of unknown function (DUF1580)
VIDPLTENLRSFGEASKALPGRPHVSTLHRWAGRGVRGRRLETVLIGGRRFTSLEALKRFAAGNGDPCGSVPAASTRPAADDVERRLDAAGF